MRRREFMIAIPPMLGLMACGDSAPAGGSGNPPAPPPPPPPPPSPVPGANVTVSIEDNRFVDPSGGSNSASVVTINAGETVGWRHNGLIPHTVSSTSVPAGAQQFDSGNLNANDTFLVTLSTVGEYMYRCNNHPATMRMARIVVE